MKLRTLLATAALIVATPVHTFAQTTIVVAEADVIGPQDLVQLIAFERAKERGVTVDARSLKSDDVTFQAVINGQADMGLGDAYEAIKNLEAPVRILCQIRKLAYVPVVDKTIYPDWKSLDGHPFAVHSRGSGTETMARIMEKKEDITFSELSYVPGAEVRVVAMQRGNIAATYLDLPGAKILLETDPERFGRLPAEGQDASDMTLYATQDFVAENEEAVRILLEEIIKAAKETVADPSFPAREREALGLLPDLTQEQIAEITPYFEEAVSVGIFPVDCGGEAAAQADLEFLAQAGTLDLAEVDPNQFWDFAPLRAATSGQ